MSRYCCGQLALSPTEDMGDCTECSSESTGRGARGLGISRQLLSVIDGGPRLGFEFPGTASLSKSKASGRTSQMGNDPPTLLTCTRMAAATACGQDHGNAYGALLSSLPQSLPLPIARLRGGRLRISSSHHHSGTDDFLPEQKHPLPTLS